MAEIDPIPSDLRPCFVSSKPRHDLDPVVDATLADLDPAAVERTLADGDPVPSLAGLLAYGVYPQQFFPQLIISVVVHPASRDGGGGPRFDDASFLKGSLPDMVDETLATLRAHMRIRGYVSASGRREQPEYPLEAVREAVVNAVLHRDSLPPVDVAAALYELGTARAGQLQEITGLSRPTVLARLRDLMAEGLVTVEGAPRSPTRTYRWTGRPNQT